jgi:hypothetical protein
MTFARKLKQRSAILWLGKQRWCFAALWGRALSVSTSPVDDFFRLSCELANDGGRVQEQMNLRFAS